MQYTGKMTRSTKKAVGVTMLIIIILGVLGAMCYALGVGEVYVMVIAAVIIVSLIVVALNLIASK